MRVVLIGNNLPHHIGSFFQRALNSLQIDHVFIVENRFYSERNTAIIHKILFRLIQLPLGYIAFNNGIISKIRKFHPDIVLIVKGAYISPKTLRYIKNKYKVLLINYATDDPFNSAVSTRDLITGIPLYDLYACPRRSIMSDIHNAGCYNVAYVPFGYEPSLHYPEAPSNRTESQNFSSDVIFIGNADPDRKPIMKSITEIRNVNFHLRGAYWDKDIQFAPYAKGFVFGRDYRLALGSTKIALCLVRRANRDGHVMRSFETPACGAFMLAERTEEHLELFCEDKEMICFSSNDEIIDKIQYYLIHETERQRIAQAGYTRVTTGHYSYQDRLEQILKLAEQMLG